MLFIDSAVHKNKVLYSSIMHTSDHAVKHNVYKESKPPLTAPKQRGSNVQKQPVYSCDQMTGLSYTDTCFKCLQMKSCLVMCRLSLRTILTSLFTLWGFV